MKELQDNKLNALITASLYRNVAKEAEAFLALDISNIPEQPRVKKQILKRAEHPRRASWSAKLRIAAVACLVILSLAFTACMSIPEIRQIIWRTIVEWHDGYIEIQFNPTSTENTSQNNNPITPETTVKDNTPSTAPTSIEIVATPTYLPDGYYGEVTESTDVMVNTVFYDASGNMKFRLSQSVLSPDGNILFQGDEEALTTIIKVNGHEGALAEYPEKPNYYGLAWGDDSYLYIIFGDFTSVHQLVTIASGIKLIAPPDPSAPPKEIEQIAKPTYWLEGMTREESSRSLFDVFSIFYDASGNMKFRLLQYVIAPDGSGGMLDSENASVSMVKINDFEGVMAAYQDMPNYYALMWQDNSYSYVIVGDFESEKELLTFAESIRLFDMDARPEHLEQIAEATYLPEGYYSEKSDPTLFQITVVYYDAKGNPKILFNQSVLAPDGGGPMVDNENANVSMISINGFEAVLVEYYDNPNNYTVVWQDNNYSYTVLGEFSSQSELMKFAEGLKIE